MCIITHTSTFRDIHYWCLLCIFTHTHICISSYTYIPSYTKRLDKQVAAYVQTRALEACARAVHDTYDLMTFEGDPGTVKQVIAYQSAWMRTVGRLVFVSKTTYHHLHALWRQNNVDIYKLRIACEKWTHHLGLCRTIRAELKTAPAPGMMRMVGFSDDGAIVAEVPVGDVAGIAQHLDLLMLN